MISKEVNDGLFYSKFEGLGVKVEKKIAFFIILFFFMKKTLALA